MSNLGLYKHVFIAPSNEAQLNIQIDLSGVQLNFTQMFVRPKIFLAVKLLEIQSGVTLLQIFYFLWHL